MRILYRQGWGVEEDPEAARDWERRAAEAGDPGAMRNLCWRYREGEGVEADLDTALDWCRRAAAAGDIKVHGMLAAFHAEGRGVPKDPARAAEIYSDGAAAARAMAERYPGGSDLAPLSAWYSYEANRLDMDPSTIGPALALIEERLDSDAPMPPNYPGGPEGLRAAMLDTKAGLLDQAGEAKAALEAYRAAMDVDPGGGRDLPDRACRAGLL